MKMNEMKEIHFVYCIDNGSYNSTRTHTNSDYVYMDLIQMVEMNVLEIGNEHLSSAALTMGLHKSFPEDEYIGNKQNVFFLLKFQHVQTPHSNTQVPTHAHK